MVEVMSFLIGSEYGTMGMVEEADDKMLIRVRHKGILTKQLPFFHNFPNMRHQCYEVKEFHPIYGETGRVFRLYTLQLPDGKPFFPMMDNAGIAELERLRLGNTFHETLAADAKYLTGDLAVADRAHDLAVRDYKRIRTGFRVEDAQK